MELRDFSDLRAPEGVIEIPLNGLVYEAEAEPAAEIVLGAMGVAGAGAELATEIAKMQTNGTLKSEDLEALARTNPVMMLRVAQAGMSQTERSVAFLQSVLMPESAERWARYMRPVPQTVPCDAADPRRVPDPDNPEAPPVRRATADEQAEHRRHQISLRQCMAVYQALMAQYSGRPTVPPSSSENGRGGNGGTSTAGVPVGASTP